MTLEEKVSKELTLAETAKGIAPYLNVTVPEVAKPKRKVKDILYGIIYWPLVAISGWRDKKLIEQIEQMCKERADEEAKMYKEMGLETRQEKDALTVAIFTGLGLVPITREYKDLPLSKELFEEKLDNCIKAGILGLGSQKAVNPEFKDQAKEWLLNEIYARASPRTELELLENVSLALDEEGNVYLR